MDRERNSNEFFRLISGLDKLRAPVPIGRARACKNSEAHPILRARTFCLVKKKKNIGSANLNRISEKTKNFTVNFKYWHVLVIF